MTLSMDRDDESPRQRIDRTVAENPVVVLGQNGCCMCHVVRKLLTSLGVHPTVIELEGEVAKTAPEPVVFVGGVLVGGLDRLIGLHLSGQLMGRLVDVGAL